MDVGPCSYGMPAARGGTTCYATGLAGTCLLILLWKNKQVIFGMLCEHKPRLAIIKLLQDKQERKE